MFAFEHFIYHVHPFGLVDHPDEPRPERKSLKEIISAPDRLSPSKKFEPHKDYHNLDSSERNLLIESKPLGIVKLIRENKFSSRWLAILALNPNAIHFQHFSSVDLKSSIYAVEFFDEPL